MHSWFVRPDRQNPGRDPHGSGVGWAGLGKEDPSSGFVFSAGDVIREEEIRLLEISSRHLKASYLKTVEKSILSLRNIGIFVKGWPVLWLKSFIF
jgi:hypothetical protein